MKQPKKDKGAFMEDFMRMAEGAFGTMAGVRGEWESLCRNQADRFLSHMDLVTREEMDVLKDLTAKVLEKLESIEKRLDAVEKSTGVKTAAPKKSK